MAEQRSPGQVGKEVDQLKLQAFLADYFQEPEDTPIDLERYSEGYSNLTYRVRFGGYDMVLRRPPFGANIKSGHDMEREYRILAGLYPVYRQVPRPLLYSDNLDVLGAPFYLMERVEGVILRDKPPGGRDLPPATLENLSKAFIENLATIHSVDYAATPLKNLARTGGVGYVERQITGWRDRYARAKTDELPQVERVGQWLADHRPPDSGLSLIHNDYKYDNMVLNPHDLTRIVAVLDWEMATIGDPLMDVGTTLGYWIQANDPPELRSARPATTTWPGNLTRAELVQHYTLQTGRSVDNVVFYYVYGLFKLAVIAQQIYARYKQGFSTDARFGQLLLTIKALGHTAVAAIERNRIE